MGIIILRYKSCLLTRIYNIPNTQISLTEVATGWIHQHYLTRLYTHIYVVYTMIVYVMIIKYIFIFHAYITRNYYTPPVVFAVWQDM